MKREQRVGESGNWRDSCDATVSVSHFRVVYTVETSGLPTQAPGKTVQTDA